MRGDAYRLDAHRLAVSSPATFPISVDWAVDWAADWEGPTLPELADRVAHQFGELPALAGVHALGFANDEPLTPGDVREVCDLLGLPAADFGLDV
jgi:hypothetical protein